MRPVRRISGPSQQRTSLVQVKIGDKYYDAVRERTCHTCTHPARMEIEQAIVANHSYRSISAMYSDVEYTSPSGEVIVLPEINYQSIRNHFKRGHLPMELAVVRTLAERRATELDAHFEELGEQFIDSKVYAQTILSRAQERVALGELRPDVRDGLSAAKLLQEMHAAGEEGESTDAAWRQAMQVYFEAAREIMEPQQWQRFTTALQTNPILQQISERFAEQRALEEA